MRPESDLLFNWWQAGIIVEAFNEYNTFELLQSDNASWMSVGDMFLKEYLHTDEIIIIKLKYNTINILNRLLGDCNEFYSTYKTYLN